MFEDAVNAGGTARDDIVIEHHEGESSITFEGMGSGECGDLLFLGVGQPVVAWNLRVVFVDLAEALFPVVEFAGGDADPGKQA